MDPEDEVVDIALTDEEWTLLFQGVHQIGGPTSISDPIAQAIGYQDATDLVRDRGLVHRVRDRGPLTRRDWRRAQLSTEVTFASSYYGAPRREWELLSSLSDATTIRLLRQVQRKLRPTVGHGRRDSHTT